MVQEMEQYAKFKKARAAVKTAHLDLDIIKAMLKEKKGKTMIPPPPSRKVKQSRSWLTMAHEA